MSLTIFDLSNEIHSLILKLCTIEDLKSVRQTCTRWGDLGAAFLNMKRIFVATQKRALQNFEIVSRNPILAQKVEEVIYDGRSIQRTLVNSQASVMQYKQHTDLYRKQQQLLDESYDYDILRKSLRRMINIGRIRMYTEFTDHPDSADDIWAWYDTVLMRENRDPLLRRRQPYLHISERDWTGPKHLFQAVLASRLEITEVRISCEALSACMTMLSLARRGPRLLQNLTILTLYVPTNRDRDPSVIQRDTDMLRLALKETKNIQEFSIDIDFDRDDPYNLNIKEVVFKQHWFHLRVLRIAQTVCAARDLIAFIKLHRKTLQEVDFDRVFLNGNWKDVGIELGSLLKLIRIKLRLSSWASLDFDTDDANRDLAHLVLAWTRFRRDLKIQRTSLILKNTCIFSVTKVA